ncbi:MAG: VOC family protein, partial [Tepidisphaeraceae bacterium]
MPHFIPDGHHTITPYLVAHNVAKLIEFVKAGLGGREIHRMTRPDGGIGHAQVQIGDSRVMMGEPMGPAQSPFPAMLYLYVPDCDAVYA